MADADLSNQPGIYSIVHAASGREYIGSAVNLARRWALHQNQLRAGKHHSAHLQNAWVKYGPDAFAFEVIELVDSPADLLAREQHYLDTSRPAFNCSPTAGSLFGYRYSPESCVRIRKAVTAAWKADPKRRELHREHANRQWSDSVERERKVAGMRGLPRSPEVRAKIAAALTGRRTSEETRAKQSAAHLGRQTGPCPPECREKIAATQRGRPRGWTYTAESRAKLSAALKGKPKSPEHVAKMLASRSANREKKRLAATRLQQLVLPLPGVQSPHQQP